MNRGSAADESGTTKPEPSDADAARSDDEACEDDEDDQDARGDEDGQDAQDDEDDEDDEDDAT